MNKISEKFRDIFLHYKIPEKFRDIFSVIKFQRNLGIFLAL